jgi:hypothetical protein
MMSKYTLRAVLVDVTTGETVCMTTWAGAKIT